MSEGAIAAAYATLFDGLDQLGPTANDTRKAVLDLIRDRLPKTPVIADMGCGTGVASLFLAAALPEAHIIAIDTHQGFLAALRATAAATKAAITALQADMAASPLDPASLDLLWCDSAIYAIGRQRALDAWRPILRPGGFIVFSDVTWTTDAPPEPARTFWAGEYPGMTTAAGVERDILAAGFNLVATQQAPGSDWQDYYQPLRQRLQTLRPEANEALAVVLDTMAQEIAIFDSQGDSYASTSFIVRPAD